MDTRNYAEPKFSVPIERFYCWQDDKTVFMVCRPFSISLTLLVAGHGNYLRACHIMLSPEMCQN